MYRKYLTPTATPRGYLRFMAVLVMCCTILAHISAMDEIHEGQRQVEVQSSDRESSDGAETGGKQTLLQRERRSVKNNSTPTLSAVEKRLQAMEER